MISRQLQRQLNRLRLNAKNNAEVTAALAAPAKVDFWMRFRSTAGLKPEQAGMPLTERLRADKAWKKPLQTGLTKVSVVRNQLLGPAASNRVCALADPGNSPLGMANLDQWMSLNRAGHA